jgi:hypothetical protein
MKIFWFQTSKIAEGVGQRSKQLEEHGFDGIMLTYHVFGGDHFTRIARSIDPESNFHYIVAMRPYVISGQYLAMICNSINEISPNRISINLLTGFIKEKEKGVGGFLSNVTDKSSPAERSQYMLDYAEMFRSLSLPTPDFYVSTSNEQAIGVCQEKNFPIIVQYSLYKQNKHDFKNIKHVVSICPTVRDDDKAFVNRTMDYELFNKQEFFNFLDQCKNNGAYGILISEDVPNSEYDRLISLIKEYRV